MPCVLIWYLGGLTWLTTHRLLMIIAQRATNTCPCLCNWVFKCIWFCFIGLSELRFSTLRPFARFVVICVSALTWKTIVFIWLNLGMSLPGFVLASSRFFQHWIPSLWTTCLFNGHLAGAVNLVSWARCWELLLFAIAPLGMISWLQFLLRYWKPALVYQILSNIFEYF